MSARNLKRFILISIVYASSFVASFAMAAQGPQTFTLDGRLKQSASSDPLLDAAATIELFILDPNKECILYAERQVINTVTSQGYFNLQVGSATGNPKRIAGSDPGLNMRNVFENTTAKSAISYPGQTCAGATYSPSANDYRVLKIVVTPSSTGVPETLSPDTVLDAVPMAAIAEQAESLQGFGASDLLQVNTAGGVNLSQANLEAAFTGGSYTNLQAILNGDYVSATTSTGVNVPTYTTASAPAGAVQGSMWYDSDTNQLKYHDGSGAVALGTTASGITSLTVGSNLRADGVAGGTLNANGTIDLANSGVTAGTYTKFTVTAKGLITGASNLTEADLPAMTASTNISGDAITGGTISGSTNISTTGTVSTSGLSTNQILLYDSDNTNYVQLVTPATGTLTANYTLTFPADDGSAGQVLTSDGSGNLSWSTAFTGVVGESLTAGQIWVGDASNQAASVTMSGDATLNSSGVLSLATDAVETINITDNNVTLGKIEQIQTSSLLGRYSPLAGDVENITLDMSDFSLDASGQLTVDFPATAINQANSTTDGYLSSGDWNTFNNKLNNSLASGNLFVGNASGTVGSMGIGSGLSIDASGNLVATGSGGTVTNVSGSGVISVINNSTTPEVSLTGVVPVSNGGTNSSAALNNNRIMVSSGGAIVESSVLSDGQVLIGQSGGAPQAANLSAGAGVSITNGSGSITITATGSGGTVTNVSGSGPISVASGTSTPEISIAQAASGVDGYLSGTDWNTFNSKLDAIVGETLATGNIWVGDGSSQAQSVSMSGDATMASSGALTIANSAVTYSKIQNVVNNNSILGRYSGANGVIEEIGLGAGISIDGSGNLVAAGSGGTVTNVSGSGPISVSNQSTTPEITIAQSGAAQDGYLSSGDWTTFNNKLDTVIGSTLASGNIFIGNGANEAVAGSISAGTGIVVSTSSGAITISSNIVNTDTGWDHIASQNISLNNNRLTNDGDAGDGILISNDGKVAIGSGAVPATMALEVYGSILVGDGGETCASGSEAGGIRYNGGNLQYCAGSGWITLGTAGAGIAGLSGDVTTVGSSGVVPATIASSAVTYAKIQDVSNNRLLGRSAGSAGVVEEIQLAPSLTFDGSGNLAAVNNGTVTSVNGSGPISSSGGTDPEISIAQAASGVDGYLSGSDWSVFNSKLGTSLASGNLLVGNASGDATAVVLSGDATIDNAGVLTIAGSAIDSAKIANGAVATADVANDAIDFTKLQNINQGLIGRSAAGSGDAEEIGLGAGLSFDGSGNLTAAGSGGTVTNVSGSGPISVSNQSTTPEITIAQSGAAQDGYLSSGDWTTFNNKLDTVIGSTLASGNIFIGNGANEAVAGSISAGTGIVVSTSSGAITISSNIVNTDTGWDHIASQNISLNNNRLTNDGDAGDGILISNDGKVAIGSGAVPATMALEVYGSILVGDGGETCASGSEAGGIRYNGGNLQYCAGSGWITLGAAGSGIAGLSGDVTTVGSSGVVPATIASSAVTYAKIQDVSNNRLLGRSAGSAGVVEEIQLAPSLTFDGSGNLAAVNNGTVTSVNGSGPISSSGGTDPEISIAQAASGVDGYLSGSDWNTFNNKLDNVVGSSLASGNLFIGDVSNQAASVTLSGDASIDNTGAVTIANDAITSAKIQDSSIATADIASSAVSFAKIQDLSASGVLVGRYDAGAGVAQEITVGAGLSIDASGNLTATNAGSVTSVTASAPLFSSGGANPNITIAQAASGVDGYLSGTDWSTFNNKLSAVTGAASIASGNLWAGNSSGVAAEIGVGTGLTIDASNNLALIDGTDNDSFADLSCGANEVPYYNGASWICVTATASNASGSLVYRDVSGDFAANDVTVQNIIADALRLENGATFYIDINTPANFTNYSLTLPADDGNLGEVLSTNGSGVLSWVAQSSGADNMGDHTASQNIILGSNWLSGDGDNEGIYVDGSGNVGVGASTPAAALDIAGEFAIDGVIMMRAPSSDTTQGNSVGIGRNALRDQESLASASYRNTAIGAETMSSLTMTTASLNTAVGFGALGDTVSGFNNVAMGAGAGRSISTGTRNVVIGGEAGRFIYGGDSNTAIGTGAMYGNSNNGDNNIAIGDGAIRNGTSGGDQNIGIGRLAGDKLNQTAGNEASDNILIGAYAGKDITTGRRNIVLGTHVWNETDGLTTGQNNILIGNEVRAPNVTDSNRLNIGNLIYASGLAEGTTVSTGNVGIGIEMASRNLHIAGPIRLEPQGSVPASPAAGDIYFDSASSNLKYHDGSAWVAVEAAGTGAVSSVTASAPLFSSGGANPNITIAQAASGVDGYLSGTDWSTFNNKLDAVVGSTLASGNLFIGNSSNQATSVAMSGDATISNAGVLTLGVNSVETANITDGDVTFAKIQDINTQSLIGRYTALPGDVEEVTLGADLSIDASGVLNLAAGAGADDMGNHTASQNIILGSNWLSGDGDNEGISISSSGNVGIGTSDASRPLHVNGSMRLTASATPASPAAGDMYVDSADSNKLKYYDGSNWIAVGGSSSAGAGDYLGTFSPSGGNIDFPLNQSYKAIKFHLVGRTTATANLEMRFSSNGGSTFLSGAVDYKDNESGGSTSMTLADTVGTGRPLSIDGMVSLHNIGVRAIMQADVAKVSDVGTATTINRHGSMNGVSGNVDYARIYASTGGWQGDTYVMVYGYPTQAGVTASGNSALSQNLITGSYWLSGDGDSEGISINASGNVGIGTASNVVALDVNGTIKVGDGGETCSATYAGAIRFNGSSMEFCNGTAWGSMGGGSGASGNLTYISEVSNASGNITISAQNGSGTVTVEGDTIIQGDQTVSGELTASGNLIVWGSLGVGTATPNEKVEINSGVADTSGLRFTQMNASSSVSSSYSGLLGVDSSGNVGVTSFPETVSISTAGYIPTMSGYTVTGPDGTITISASSEYSASWAAWKAFNDSSGVNNQWATNGVTTNFWLRVDLPVAKTFGAFSLAGRLGYGEHPTSWAVQGSNDGTVWTDLYTSNQDLNIAEAQHVISSPQSFTSYRFYAYTGTSPNPGLEVLQFYDYVSAPLIGYQAWSAIGNSGIDDTTNFLGTVDAKDLIFKTNNVERMRITSSGNVAIGTTTASYPLSVAGIIETTTGGIRFPDGTLQTTAAGATGGPRSITHSITNSGGDDGVMTPWTTDGGLPLATLRTAGPAPYSGSHYFMGSNVPNARMKQTFDLLAEGWSSAELDSGSVTVDVGWYQTSFSDSDKAGATVRYLDSGMSVISSTVVTPVAASSASWGARSLSGSIPPNTRHIELVFIYERASGTNSDGYVDEITMTTTYSDNIETYGGWVTNDGDNEGIYITTTGLVGIGTASAVVALDVNGTIKAGNGGETCDSTTAGGIRYNAGDMEYCDGSSWMILASGSSGGSLTNVTSISNASGNINISAQNGSGTVTIEGNTTFEGDTVASGNVTVNGRFVAGISSDADALTSITVDFSSTNMIRATGAAAACGTLNFTNVAAGGSYTVTIPNASATCTTIHLNGATTNVKLPASYVSGFTCSGVVYTAIYDGTTLWVSAVPF